MNAMVALERCRRAWERTSPQLVIDGWLDMLDELDAPQPSALRCVEPVRTPSTSPAGGLTAGAEPRCEQDEGLTARRPFAADTGSSVSSAPFHTTAAAASLRKSRAAAAREESNHGLH